MLSSETRNRRLAVIDRRIEAAQARAAKLREQADRIDLDVIKMRSEQDWLRSAPVEAELETSVPEPAVAEPAPVTAVVDPELVEHPVVLRVEQSPFLQAQA